MFEKWEIFFFLEKVNETIFLDVLWRNFLELSGCAYRAGFTYRLVYFENFLVNLVQCLRPRAFYRRIKERKNFN